MKMGYSEIIYLKISRKASATRNMYSLKMNFALTSLKTLIRPTKSTIMG